MKCIIKTRRHFGDHNICRQGIQFQAHFVNAPTDTADDYKAMHELVGIVREDCKEAGWYFGFCEHSEHDNRSGGRTAQCGETPYTPRERVLKARCVSAENLAKQYKAQMDAMRLVLLRNNLSVGEK